MYGPPSDDWILAAASRHSEFRLDVGFACPRHVPSWLLATREPLQGRREDLRDAAPVPLVNGFAMAADFAGRASGLLAYYRQVLALASPFEPGPGNGADTSRFGCFAVDVFLLLDGEPPVRFELFSTAARGCRALLSRLANPVVPTDGTPAGLPVELYDNLDQGWALRMVSTRDMVCTLEWDWEEPDWEADARALGFDRQQVTVEAEAALTRLDAVHTMLVANLGHDFWNVP